MDNVPLPNHALSVEVCYILPDAQFLRSLTVSPGTTLGQAIGLSGVLEVFPDINLEQQKIGVYSKIQALDVLVREQDRIEIYRALLVDPMAARRTRAIKAKVTPT